MDTKKFISNTLKLIITEDRFLMQENSVLLFDVSPAEMEVIMISLAVDVMEYDWRQGAWTFSTDGERTDIRGEIAREEITEVTPDKVVEKITGEHDHVTLYYLDHEDKEKDVMFLLPHSGEFSTEFFEVFPEKTMLVEYGEYYARKTLRVRRGDVEEFLIRKLGIF